jgi:hypothetical protein
MPTQIDINSGKPIIPEWLDSLEYANVINQIVGDTPYKLVEFDDDNFLFYESKTFSSMSSPSLTVNDSDNADALAIKFDDYNFKKLILLIEYNTDTQPKYIQYSIFTMNKPFPYSSQFTNYNEYNYRTKFNGIYNSYEDGFRVIKFNLRKTLELTQDVLKESIKIYGAE